MGWNATIQEVKKSIITPIRKIKIEEGGRTYHTAYII